jgi:hypothetical protein
MSFHIAIYRSIHASNWTKAILSMATHWQRTSTIVRRLLEITVWNSNLLHPVHVNFYWRRQTWHHIASNSHTLPLIPEKLLLNSLATINRPCSNSTKFPKMPTATYAWSSASRTNINVVRRIIWFLYGVVLPPSIKISEGNLCAVSRAVFFVCIALFIKWQWNPPLFNYLHNRQFNVLS